jgi:UDP-glucose 4-epimerase
MGTLATYNVLEAMRRNEIRDIVFASTSAIYGEATRFPTPEDYGPLLPISLYGASKLAGEALISAFCHGFQIRGWIFRFGNVVGKNGTHGALVDFIGKLRENPKSLTVLGDGSQAKPYLHVSECVEGMLFGTEHAEDSINVFNLTCEGATPVRWMAERTIEKMGLTGVDLQYTSGNRGWVGDVPQVRLDPSKIRARGWQPRLSSNEAVERGIKELLEQA